jgi:hypothetical protein
MQHAMVADGKANASRGEPQDKMMAAQREGHVMALFVTLAERFLSGLGGRISVVTSTHGVIHFDAAQPQQACAAK